MTSPTIEVDMRVRSLLSASAILLALFGLFLVLQTGAALSSLGNVTAPSIASGDPAALAYLQTAAFARLFGITLLAFGMALWHVKPLVGDAAERRIGLTLGAGFGLAGLIALVQQVAILGASAGWLIPIAFFGLAVLFTGAGLRATPTETAPSDMT